MMSRFAEKIKRSLCDELVLHWPEYVFGLFFGVAAVFFGTMLLITAGVI
jgi:hypothetical protein